MTTQKEIDRRNSNIRAAMTANNVDALIVCGNQYTGFEGAVRYTSGFEIVHRYVYVVLPLEGEPTAESAINSPEDRAALALRALEEEAVKHNDLALLSDHLSLLRRWYYRPEKQRIGEIFFANEDGTWPIRKVLRGAARTVIGDPKPMADTQRDAAKSTAKELKTRILHEGRADVERTIPVLPQRPKH